MDMLRRLISRRIIIIIIIPTVGGYKRKTCLSRHDSVLLNRLHIGRSCLTHSISSQNVVFVSAHSH